MLYRLKEDYPAALARSQEAEALARKLGNEALLADHPPRAGPHLHRAWPAPRPTTRRRRGHRQAAFDRFTESLAISRRIGDEAGAARLAGRAGQAADGTQGGCERRSRRSMRRWRLTNAWDNPAQVGIGLEFLGSVHERQGQLAAALEKYQQALESVQQYGPPQTCGQH